MSWPYRSKCGDDPGPIAGKPKPQKPAAVPNTLKSNYLTTLAAFLNERMHHVMPGCHVDIQLVAEYDEIVIRYFVPARVLSSFRDNAGRMLEAIAGNTPETGVDAVERATVRRRKMAIGRFRLGKFGR